MPKYHVTLHYTTEHETIVDAESHDLAIEQALKEGVGSHEIMENLNPDRQMHTAELIERSDTKTYDVLLYYSTFVTMRVDAKDEDSAIEKANRQVNALDKWSDNQKAELLSNLDAWESEIDDQVTEVHYP